MNNREIFEERRKLRLRVIKTYPDGEKIATCVYEGTREELCIELSKYIGGRKTFYRRILEKWLREYEKEHEDEGVSRCGIWLLDV